MVQSTPSVYSHLNFLAPVTQSPVYSQWVGPGSANRPGKPVIPDSNTVTAKLTTRDAVRQGAQNGLMFGLLGAAPLYWLERQTQGKHFLQLLTDAFIPPSSAPSPGGKYSKWVQFLGSTKGHVTSTVSSLALLSTLAGGTLGWWMIGHVKDRLLEINRVKQEQAQGIFTPKKPTLAQRVGLAEKPVDDPDQAYQDLLDKGLNPAQAFQQGVKDTFILKVVKGLIPLGLMAGLLAIVNRGALGQFAKETAAQSGDWIKSLFHPVVLAKMAILPIIGGFVAKKFVPWMRTELGIDHAQSQSVQSQTAQPQAGQLAAAQNPVQPVAMYGYGAQQPASTYRTAAI